MSFQNRIDEYQEHQRDQGEEEMERDQAKETMERDQAEEELERDEGEEAMSQVEEEAWRIAMGYDDNGNMDDGLYDGNGSSDGYYF